MENLYILTSAIPSSYFASSSSLSSAIPTTGLPAMQIMVESTYAQLTAFDSSLVSLFTISPKKPFTIQCEEVEGVTEYNNMFDYDVMEYRKVIDVIDDNSILVSGHPWEFDINLDPPAPSSNASRLAQQFISLVSETGPFYYSQGGANEFANLLDSISAYKYSKRFNSFGDVF